MSQQISERPLLECGFITDVILKRNAKILDVQTQFNRVVVFSLQESTQEDVLVQFRTVGTDDALDEDLLTDYRYIGTALLHGSSLAVHVFANQDELEQAGITVERETQQVLPILNRILAGLTEEWAKVIAGKAVENMLKMGAKITTTTEEEATKEE